MSSLCRGDHRTLGHTGEMDPVAVDPAHRLARIEADGRRLLAVAGRDLTRAVPACPGWDTRRLIGHIARVWTSVGAHVATQATEMIPSSDIASPPDDDRVVDFGAAALDELLTAFATVDPHTPVWTWTSQHDVAFYHRRMHQETLVHRVDAELALGDSSVVDPDDGADGVDELFTVILDGRRGDDLPSGSLHLHRTDGPGEWLLDVVDGGMVVRREHAKGDAAVRATGDELLLAMWRRRSLDGLEVFGDITVAEAWAGLSP